MPQTPSLLNAIGKAMRHLGDRQRVIAQNIANSDTPGYKARELAPPSFAGMVEHAGGEISRPHVVASDAMRRLGAKPSAPANLIRDPGISEVKPDGNDVTLEDQLLKMGQIQSDYAALTGIYARQRGMIRTALSKGGVA
jgi:flagellar basal-body rod protein FlgB